MCHQTYHPSLSPERHLLCVIKVAPSRPKSDLRADDPNNSRLRSPAVSTAAGRLRARAGPLGEDLDCGSASRLEGARRVGFLRKSSVVGSAFGAVAHDTTRSRSPCSLAWSAPSCSPPSSSGCGTRAYRRLAEAVDLDGDGVLDVTSVWRPGVGVSSGAAWPAPVASFPRAVRRRVTRRHRGASDTGLR